MSSPGPEWRLSLPLACCRSGVPTARTASCAARPWCRCRRQPSIRQHRRPHMFKLLITADELGKAIASRNWLIFDVRHDLADHEAGRRAYEQGHIPGALFLDHEQQLSAPKTGRNGRHPLPDRDDFAALMRSQGLTRQSQVVVYDGGNSMFAAHLWWMLRWLGHEQVAILDGGWPAWVAAGGEVQTGTNAASVTEAQAVQTIGAPREAGMPVVDAQAV